MSHFKEPVIDFGTVKRNSSSIITFKALHNIPNIIDIRVACGCTKVKWDSTNKELRVTYKAGEIPNQVVGDQEVRKEITIVYSDKSTEILSLRGIKTR